MTKLERESYLLRLPAALKAQMEEAAAEHGRSLNAELIQACKAWLTQKWRQL